MARARKGNYTDEDIIRYCAESSSYRQVLTKLELNETGGNYKSLKKNIKRLNIDIGHFHGKVWNKGKEFSPKRELEEYFSNKYPITSHRLRLRLIKEGFKDAKCEWCLLTEWRSEPIPLELDHIDGDHDNNNLENLRILCPNCHYQTPTHRGRNIKIGRKTKEEKDDIRREYDKQRRAKNKKERVIQYKIDWPSVEEMTKLVWETSVIKIARELGVSNNAVGNFCKRHDIKKPPRGYWRKVETDNV